MKVSVVKQVVLLRFLVSSANLKFNPQKFFLPVFIGLFLLTVTATAQTTYYVSYNGNDINGTGSQSNPWRTIQNAIDKAVPRDIIKVMDDNDSTTADFTENVIVNKPLTITRFDSVDANPQVKADKCNQHVFMITADNVIIIGLDIYGATEKNLAGIYLDNVSGCKILNNRCGWGNSCLNYIGILNFAGNKNLLLYNSCILNSYCGIKLDSLSTNNIVMGNICQPNRNGGCGICLQYSIKNTISGNHCTNGSSTEGIKLLFSNENVISDNDCSHHIDGTCIELRNSSYNSILRNNCCYSSFCIYLYASNQNLVTGNNCYRYGYCLSLRFSSNNRIYFNNFFNLHFVIRSKDNSTNSWHSPTEMYFEYNSSLHKSYLGNFYFNHDLTDIDEDGIADNPYNLPGDEPDDNFPLAATIENYSFNYSKSEVISFKMNHPKMYQLSQNYPNPFNPSTTINYSLPQPGFIKITIYDKLGRMVRTLVDVYQVVGEHSVAWDGRNFIGEMVSSGMYFYSIQFGDGTQISRSMIMLK